MKPGLIIVSNRLPVSVKKIDGKLEFFPSVGGLATGLASYTGNSKNKWIGWPGITNDEITEKDRQQITTELKKSNCYPVFLSKKQLASYYNGYCNRILWPLLHDIEISAAALEAEAEQWKSYQHINELYAETVFALSTQGNVIWVHDYQLMLLPALIRAERPDDKIGFFLHVPFPDVKNFSKLKEGEAIVAGLLGAGLVGFHTSEYSQHFLDTVQQYDLGITLPRKVLLLNRVVRVLDFPMGIDYAKYAKARKSRAVEQELAKLQLEYIGKKVVLTVDRLDPSKGLVERTAAYQMLLRQNPDLWRKVVMIMVVVPSRTEIDEYKQLKIRLDSLIDEVNKEFGTKRWRPIIYRYEALPFEQVTALYRLADVAFIVPLRDGMNLVAKEYLASKPYQRGVLVLSKTAGAAEELKEAVMVNPNKQASVVRGLKRAIAMPRGEFRLRIKHMQKQLETANVHVWAGGFMKTLRQSDALVKSYTATLTQDKQPLLIGEYMRANKRLLLLDYDGVLAPFFSRPEEAKPSIKMRKVIRKLGEEKANDIVIISGRSKDDLQDWFGDLNVALVAEHGIYTKGAQAKTWQSTPNNSSLGWQDIILPVLEKYARLAPGAFVEEKSTALVWHYRKASPYNAQKYLVILKRVLKPLAAKYGLQAKQGNKILEIRPSGVNKGTSATAWLDNTDADFILAIGDDYTDEDMFASLPVTAFTVKVGRGSTKARLRLKNPAEVLEFLTKLTQK